MEIYKIIKKRRQELGLTLNDVAKAMGVAESTVSRYESSDIQNMGIDKIEALSRILSCSPAYLMGWETSIQNSYNLNDIEEKIICTYRNADNMTKEMVLRILKIEASSEKKGTVPKMA